MRRTILKAGLVAPLLSACVHNPIRPHEGWKEIRSAHFRVYAKDGYRAEAVVEWLETSHAALTAFLRDRGVEPGARTAGIEVLFLDEGVSGDFQGFFGYDRGSAALEVAPGPGPIGARGLLVLRSWASEPAAAALAHHFVEALVPRAPRWLHEGFAGLATRLLILPGDGGAPARALLWRAGPPGGPQRGLAPSTRSSPPPRPRSIRGTRSPRGNARRPRSGSSPC